MVTDRQKQILKVIVEEYVKSAKPVSSNHICDKLKCSSATIRNEMVILEEAGMLEKNHFASGRTPSENGYKYYVENLMEPKKMTGEDMLKLQTIFRNNALDVDDTIKKSIELISEITNYTSVVLGSTSSMNKLKKVEVVPLEEDSVLTIVITDKGHVEHKKIVFPTDVSADEVRKTVDLINKLIVGTPIDEVSEKLEYEIKPIISKYVKQHDVLYNAFYDAFNEFTNKNNVEFVGRNNFLKQPEFNDIDKVKDVLNGFENIGEIKRVDNDGDDGIKIYIGTESQITNDVAVVTTKYNLDGEEKTIAIIGPKRMEYDRVVSMLDYIKEKIEGE